MGKGLELIVAGGAAMVAGTIGGAYSSMHMTHEPGITPYHILYVTSMAVALGGMIPIGLGLQRQTPIRPRYKKDDLDIATERFAMGAFPKYFRITPEGLLPRSNCRWFGGFILDNMMQPNEGQYGVFILCPPDKLPKDIPHEFEGKPIKYIQRGKLEYQSTGEAVLQ